jgi:transcription-repair coupling factor (superfamily II helicase)
VPGHAFSSDSHWQQEFEDAFEYELTPDQKTAIADIKRDMESPTPMDRLLWRRRLRQDRGRDARRVQGGDGRQAGGVSRADDGAGVPASEDAARALRRVPGAHRHGQPVPIQAEQKESLADLRAGKVDIIVGTHRLLSRTSSSAISVSSSSTKSSASGLRTRRRSSSCARRSTC